MRAKRVLSVLSAAMAAVVLCSGCGQTELFPSATGGGAAPEQETVYLIRSITRYEDGNLISKAETVYDANGLPVSRTVSQSDVSYTYVFQDGNLIYEKFEDETMPSGRTGQYDDLGRLVYAKSAVEYPLFGTSGDYSCVLTYDSSGNLTGMLPSETDSLCRATPYFENIYNEANQLSAVCSFWYGDRYHASDGDKLYCSEIYRYQYQPDGNVLQISLERFDGGNVQTIPDYHTFVYSEEGTRVTINDGNDQTNCFIDYLYDDSGRLIQRIYNYEDNGPSYSYVSSSTFSYDENGNVVSIDTSYDGAYSECHTEYEYQPVKLPADSSSYQAHDANLKTCCSIKSHLTPFFTFSPETSEQLLLCYMDSTSFLFY